MSNTAIRAEGLGKSYLIGHNADDRARYTALRDVLSNGARDLARKTRDMFTGRAIVQGDEIEEFWALQNLNFEIQQGDRVGIIGRNGAGKSTLLKILSRITEPTTGRITLNGRVASLLEVGTGFHPELSGRENIYLNGAILGMSRAEVRAKFDEIVDFSGVEKFLDTPVKRYSSGMYVRLAFAVAAHLEPEILVVDEVLAVGDVAFQKRCLGKMEDISRGQGRTILFVSHNMGAIGALCNRGIVLNAGKVVFDGSVGDALSIYSNEGDSAQQWEGAVGDEHCSLVKTWVRPLEGAVFETAVPLEVGIEVEIHQPTENLILGFRLSSTHSENLAYVLHDDSKSDAPKPVAPGRLVRRFVIPANTLAQGDYGIDIDLGIHGVKSINKEAGRLRFSLDNVRGQGRRYMLSRDVRGYSGLFRPKWAVDE